MPNICILLTTDDGCGTIESVAPVTPLDTDIYDTCLMLTRLFLGREDQDTASNLYAISRLFKPNRVQEEVQQDGDNRVEAQNIRKGGR